MSQVGQVSQAALVPGWPPELLQFAFMQQALVAAVLVGLAAPAVGVFLVQKRMALMGDGIGHVALTGVALGFLLGTAPVLTAVVVASLGAVVIELVRQHGRTSGDVALALMFYGGIAGGVVLMGLAPGGTNARLLSYLFGSLTSVSPEDVVVIAVLSLLLLGVLLALGRELFAVCHDEEHARVCGLPVRGLNLLLAVLAAVTVTVAMRVVGLLLVSALMVVPVAAASASAAVLRRRRPRAPVPGPGEGHAPSPQHGLAPSPEQVLQPSAPQGLATSPQQGSAVPQQATP